ncbi:MAG: TM0996/MTH895 family glutaredoxin-like protein [Spirochaetales bacterium]|nr:TM0996/MTH895 family glutaredoxin-like protein [Spirochaetales bacterium]
MKIEILGSGCPSCMKLEKNAEAAVKSAGIDAEIVKVTDMTDIMNYGVTRTPALVVDGIVKSSGKVLKADEILKVLKDSN